MIVVVTGSRRWLDYPTLAAQLDGLHATYDVKTVIHGFADGADRLSGRWAPERGCMEVAIPYASAHGKQGGPIRNGWLLDVAQALATATADGVLVVAFPTPESVGTWNCVTQAKQRGLRIRIVRAQAHDSE